MFSYNVDETFPESALIDFGIWKRHQDWRMSQYNDLEVHDNQTAIKTMSFISPSGERAVFGSSTIYNPFPPAKRSVLMHDPLS